MNCLDCGKDLGRSDDDSAFGFNECCCAKGLCFFCCVKRKHVGEAAARDAGRGSEG